MKKAHKFKRIFAGVVLAMTLVSTAVPSFAAPREGRYSVRILRKATENEKGLREYTYEDGSVYLEEIPETGHVWGEWIVDRQATENTPGHRYRVCTKYPNHPHTQEETIPALSQRHQDRERESQAVSSAPMTTATYAPAPSSAVSSQGANSLPSTAATSSENSSQSMSSLLGDHHGSQHREENITSQALANPSSLWSVQSTAMENKNEKGIASITQQKETSLDGQDMTTEKDQQKRTVAMSRETKEGMLKSMGESSKGIDGSEKNASANTGTKSTEIENTAEAVKGKNDVSSNAENAKNSADSAEEMTQPEGANENPSAKEGTDQLVREKNKGTEDMQINAIDVLTSCATVGVVGWAAVVLWPMFLALRWAEQKRKQIRERGYASKK